MSNHNSLSLSSENDNDDDDDEPSLLASVTPSGSRKPLLVNNNLINFSLSRQKEQQDRQSIFEHEKDGDETSKAEKKSKDKEADAGSTPSRRKEAGRSLRNILKRTPAQNEQSTAEQPVNAGAEALTEPAKSESTLPKRPNLMLVGAAGAAAAAANRPPAAENSPDSTESADSGSLAEIIPLFKPKEGNNTEDETEAIPDIEPVATAANAAPDPADTLVTPPSPPVPPTRPPAGGGAGGGAGAGGGPGGGGNVPPIPPAVQAANFGPQPPNPNVPNPNLPNQAPVVIEKGGDGWVPAVLAFMGATYFRRRGERRTNRKIEKTNKELAETQSQVETERRRTRGNEQRALEQRDRDRRAAPIIPLVSTGSNRAEASPAGTIERPVSIVNNYSEATPPAIKRPEEIQASHEAAQRVEKQAESIIRPVKAAEVVAGSLLARELTQREAAKKEVLKQADEAKATERQWRAIQTSENIQRPLNEAGLDRRHETTGDPALRQRITPAAIQPRANTGTPLGSSSTSTSDPASSALSGTQSQPSASMPQDIYKKSMRAGFVTGISVIVLGLLAFLLLK